MKQNLLLASLSVVLAGCTSSIFGCPDRLIETAVSPGNLYKAVTRECGCRASAGTYVVTAIIKREDSDECSTLEKIAIAYVRTTDSQGMLSISWTDKTSLLVTPVGASIFPVRNPRVFELDFFPPGLEPDNVRAEKERTPKISIANALPSR